MKSRTFLILTLVGLLIFFVGWFLRDSVQEATDRMKDSHIVNGFIDTVSQTDTPLKSIGFAHRLSGRFILTESNCAGLNFITSDKVLWTNEIACNDPDTLNLRWLSDSIFMTRSTLRITESCPPGVDIYKVVSFDEKHLNLKSIWTGWNDSKDANLELIKQPN
jgi:hypothetical protein